MNDLDDNFEFADPSLEVAAAKLSIAFMESDGALALPPSLRAKLEQLATQHISESRARTANGTEIPRDSLRITEGTAVSAPTSGLHGWVPPRLLPYVRSLSSLAAAACILLGMAIFYYSVSQSPAAKRDALAAKAGTEAGVVRWTWSAWGSKPNQISNGTTGDVVWDTAEQSGFMTFAGLPRIDETKEVFQLWIIDADRPGENPVDGGTFTAAGAGQVIVPYYARVKVGRPAAFAVTIEKAGGAVVSDQARKVIIASPPQS